MSLLCSLGDASLPPAAALEGLVGCTAIRTRLAEYQAVVEAAARAGRDPLEDLADVEARRHLGQEACQTMGKGMGWTW